MGTGQRGKPCAKSQNRDPVARKTDRPSPRMQRTARLIMRPPRNRDSPALGSSAASPRGQSRRPSRHALESRMKTTHEGAPEVAQQTALIVIPVVALALMVLMV